MMVVSFPYCVDVVDSLSPFQYCEMDVAVVRSMTILAVVMAVVYQANNSVTTSMTYVVLSWMWLFSLSVWLLVASLVVLFVSIDTAVVY